MQGIKNWTNAEAAQKVAHDRETHQRDLFESIEKDDFPKWKFFVQPTISRLENAPSKIEIARLMEVLVEGFCESYRRAPSSITLDIDDTCDTVHGHQQLSLFNAHYDERCFLPIHIYDAASGKPKSFFGSIGQNLRTSICSGWRSESGHSQGTPRAPA
jgi:hypothetical protein